MYGLPLAKKGMLGNVNVVGIILNRSAEDISQYHWYCSYWRKRSGQSRPNERTISSAITAWAATLG